MMRIMEWVFIMYPDRENSIPSAARVNNALRAGGREGRIGMEWHFDSGVALRCWLDLGHWCTCAVRGWVRCGRQMG
jgi:hypothetical protein